MSLYFCFEASDNSSFEKTSADNQNSIMNRSEVQSSIAPHTVELRERFNVRELFLFGSVARNENTESSDIDFLVRFNGKASFDGYMDLKLFLETLFSTEVDLVTEKALKSQLRHLVFKEAVRVA